MPGSRHVSWQASRVAYKQASRHSAAHPSRWHVGVASDLVAQQQLRAAAASGGSGGGSSAAGQPAGPRSSCGVVVGVSVRQRKVEHLDAVQAVGAAPEPGQRVARPDLRGHHTGGRAGFDGRF
eukprot:249095-Chlamydomonas_euryale.AAC.2